MSTGVKYSTVHLDNQPSTSQIMSFDNFRLFPVGSPKIALPNKPTRSEDG